MSLGRLESPLGNWTQFSSQPITAIEGGTRGRPTGVARPQAVLGEFPLKELPNIGGGRKPGRPISQTRDKGLHRNVGFDSPPPPQSKVDTYNLRNGEAMRMFCYCRNCCKLTPHKCTFCNGWETLLCLVCRVSRMVRTG